MSILCIKIEGQQPTRGLDKITIINPKKGNARKMKIPKPTKTKKIASAVFNFLSILCDLLHCNKTLYKHTKFKINPTTKPTKAA